jgi:MinD superfamily P-loop ATPase
MILSIASGKGGTGKTLIAANIAISVGGNIQLLDCDVEEPNLHLLLHPKVVSEETVYSMVPSVNEELCDHCGRCSSFCSYKALFVTPMKILVFPELCHGCGSCILACPKKAINEGKRIVGVLKRGYKNSIELIYGELKIGERMTTLLIREVKNISVEMRKMLLSTPHPVHPVRWSKLLGEATSASS